MKNLKIKQKVFLNWYFNTGADQEQEHEQIALGQQVIEQLIDKGVATITAQEIFDECNHETIPINLVGNYRNDGTEIGDLWSEYNVELIK